MPDNDIRPIESDDTYTYDVQAAGYQGRARTAASQYRSTSNPSNFEPAPTRLRRILSRLRTGMIFLRANPTR